MSKQTSIQAQAAKAIRAELKKMGIMAKVTSTSASMMTAVNVTLTDLAPEVRTKVEQLAKNYQSGKFDSMQDMYVHHSHQDDLPRVKYVTVNTEFTSETRQKALEIMRQELPDDSGLEYDGLIIGKISPNLDYLANQQSILIYRICMGSDPDQRLSKLLWS